MFPPGYKIPGPIKSAYGRTLRLLRKPAGMLGILRFLETNRHNRYSLYLRTLFSIYDVEDLVHLDLPWWSFDAIEAIERFLCSRRGSCCVFEYGSGASTVWLAKRAATVRSVEHDPIWAMKIKHLCRPFPHVSTLEKPPETNRESARFFSRGCKYRGLSFDNYVFSIKETQSDFDMIVVDGMCRAACLKMATQHIKSDGIIVFDDSGRQYWSPAVDVPGFIVKRFRGLTVALPYPSETAILTKR